MDLFQLLAGFWGWVAVPGDWFWGHFLPGIYALRTPEQWDAIRNWVVALGGVVALFVALRTYRMNSRTRREAQARFVYAKVTTYSVIAEGNDIDDEPYDSAIEPKTHLAKPDDDPYTFGGGDTKRKALTALGRAAIRVNNGSDELIGPVKVQVANTSTGKVWPNVAIIIPVIEPEGLATVVLLWSGPPVNDLADVTPVILFRDASGQWWKRFGAEPIKRVHTDPENSSLTKAQRDARAPILGAGGEKVRKERVPFWALVHRAGRLLMGKSPTP